MPQVEDLAIQVLDNGIHCAGCEARIESVLARLGGVEKAKADHKTQMIRLTLDVDDITAQEVREKLDELGYRTSAQEV